MKKNKIRIQDLLNFFPKVSLPITLSEDMASAFSANNKPIPNVLYHHYIIAWENEEYDEYTEYVPCLQLDGLEDFHALVYWKGGLLKYEFILVTLTLEGDLISRRPIASTMSDNFSIRSSVAHIDEDLSINIMAGEELRGETYDTNKSQSFGMEITHDGTIIFIND